MMLTVQGRIVGCLPPQSGISKSGNEWKSQHFVIAVNDNEEDLLGFQVFGEDKILSYDLRNGKRVAVTVDITSSEWNGKMVTNCSCKQCWVMPPKADVPRTISSNEFDYD